MNSFAVQNREIFCLLKISVLDSLIGKDYIAKKLKVFRDGTKLGGRLIKISELMQIN